MADNEDTSGRAPRKPTAKEWSDAIRIASGKLRSKQPTLFERASEIAKDAAQVAAGRWRGEAAFSTLTTTIAMRKAAKLAKLEIRQKQPRKAPIRRRPDRGEASALAPVFRDFLAHAETLLHDAPFGARRTEIGATIRLLLGHYFLFLLDHYKVRPAVRPRFRFAPDFDARVDAFARKVFGAEWVESDATIQAPLPGITGKPPHDPYRPPAELDGDAELPAFLSDLRNRHAGLIFEEKRERAIQAVIRFALSAAGYGGSVLNAVLGPVRVASTREATGRRTKAFSAIETPTDGHDPDS